MKTNFLAVFICLAIFTRCTLNDDVIEDVVPDDVPAKESFQVAKISINTENSTSVSSKDIYINCSIALESNKNEWNYSGTGKIKGRGNSSWLWYPKKPFRLKLDEKDNLLGLKSARDWVLLADYRDPTHLMNTYVFTVGQGLGIPFPNHSRYVEVTLNNNYIGMYILTEQVEQGENRVAIDETGGILLSLDVDDGPELSPGANDNFWSSVYRMPVCVKSPEIIYSTQLSGIKSDFAQLETAIKGADYAAVAKLFDIPVFIDFLIIQELVYNVEVDAPRSMYLHKNKGGKWTMGPLWDFDAGFDFDWGTMYTGHNYFKSYKELVLGTSPLNHTGGYNVPSFFTDLFRNKQFVAEYKARWLVVKEKLMTDYWDTTQLYANGFAEAMQHDAKRWPIDKNNAAEIQKMKLWLTSRIGYLNSVIENYPAGTK